MKKIKYYTNRKLYDTDLSGYITLNDILNYIKTGVEFQVIRQKDKVDITRSTTQMAVMTLVDLDLNTLSNLVRA